MNNTGISLQHSINRCQRIIQIERCHTEEFAFVVCHSPGRTEDDPKLLKESLIIISDNLKHDSEAVLVFTGELIILDHVTSRSFIDGQITVGFSISVARHLDICNYMRRSLVYR